MKLRSRRPNHTTVVAYLAFFGVLATGGAYAANTILSTDIVDGEVKTADLAGNGVTNGKLAADARTHAFSYSGSTNDATGARHVVVNLGGLRLAVRCDKLAGLASVEVFAKNTANTLAQANGGWVVQNLHNSSSEDGSAIDGFALNPGSEQTLDASPVGVNLPMIWVTEPASMRAEGQITFHRDGSNDVTTVDFHAYVSSPGSGGSCEFQGTAVHAVP